MDRVKTVAAEIRAYCEAHADPKLVIKYSRYFKEGYDAWGIDGKDPMWSEKRDEWMEKIRPAGLAGIFKLGELNFAKGKYEEASMAIQFASRCLDEIDSIDGFARWFEAGIKDWAHVDVLCGMVLSPLLERGAIRLDAFDTWRSSKLRFQRRAVPVAMLALLKTEKDYRPLLEFLRPMMLDPERVVHQGLGWFLREAWKKSPKPVERFLLEFKDTAPRLIFQYATEKMTPEARNRFRAAKKATKKAPKKSAK